MKLELNLRRHSFTINSKLEMLISEEETLVPWRKLCLMITIHHSMPQSQPLFLMNGNISLTYTVLGKG